MAKAPVRARKRVRKQVSDGVAHIHASFNNTIVVTPIPHNGCRPPKKRRV